MALRNPNQNSQMTYAERRSMNENAIGKIKAGQIITRFMKHVKGTIEMSPTQVAAGKALLDRVLPSLRHIEHEVEVEHVLTKSEIDGMLLHAGIQPSAVWVSEDKSGSVPPIESIEVEPVVEPKGVKTPDKVAK